MYLANLMTHKLFLLTMVLLTMVLLTMLQQHKHPFDFNLALNFPILADNCMDLTTPLLIQIFYYQKFA